jgi:hypothetical protein
MKKFWEIVICVALVSIMSVASFACSSTSKTTESSPINLQQMANDIDSLKSSVSILNNTISGITINGGGISQESFDAFKSEFYTLKARVDLIQAPAQDVTQEEFDMLSEQVLSANDSINDLVSQLATLDTSIGSMQAEIDALKTSVAALQTPSITSTVIPTVYNSVNLSIAAYGTGTIDGSIDTEQTLYFIAHYTNTANVSFNNVKFQIAFYTSLPKDATLSDRVYYCSLSSVGGLIPITNLWARVINDNVYTFTSFQGVTIPAGNASGGTGEIDVMFKITLKTAVSASTTYTVYPIISIM